MVAGAKTAKSLLESGRISCFISYFKVPSMSIIMFN